MHHIMLNRADGRSDSQKLNVQSEWVGYAADNVMRAQQVECPLE